MSLTPRISTLRQIRLLGETARQLSCDAETVVGTALRLWCQSDFLSAPKTNLKYSSSLKSTKQMRDFVSLLRQMEFLEASYWLSSAYAMLIEEGHRKALAMFFTPLSLTRGLLDDLTNHGADFGRHSFLDPACGGAAFLAPIAIRMRTALEARGLPPRARLEHIEKHLSGVDKDSTLCKLSRQFLYMALHEDIESSGYAPTFSIAVGDSLQTQDHNLRRHDVVICNPPYRKLAASETASLPPAFTCIVEAQPNIYGLFIFQCTRLVREGGLVALVTPASFLSGQYFSRLRNFLVKNTQIKHIGLVSGRVGIFIDVQQETVLTVLSSVASCNRTKCETSVSVVSVDGEYTAVGSTELPCGEMVWPIPRTVSDVALLRLAADTEFRLTDYGYKVRIGTYVWNRDPRPSYATLKDARKARASTAVPLLWSGDISPNGRLNFEPAAKSGNHHFVDFGDKRHASMVHKPCVIMQRVTSNEQTRRLVAAPVPKKLFQEYCGFVGENHVVVLEPVIDIPALKPSQLAKLFSSHAVDRLYRCISGATNLSVFELNQLALPDPEKLKQLLAGGSAMEQAVNQAYGLGIE
jgi:adenine-specific DNA-methyltransferase